jgi:hypothetical protein
MCVCIYVYDIYIYIHREREREMRLLFKIMAWQYRRNADTPILSTKRMPFGYEFVALTNFGKTIDDQI